MADGPEDDITILDIGCAEIPHEWSRPVFSFQPPTPSSSVPEFSSQIHPASHHALSFAYCDLKKRYNELEGKNKKLIKNLYKAKRTLLEGTDGSTCTMNGDIRYEENTRIWPQVGGNLLMHDNQTDSCEDTETNLMSDTEAAVRFRNELVREKKSKVDLQAQLQTAKMESQSREDELKKVKEKLQSLEDENRDLRDENVSVKRKLKDSQETIISLTQAKVLVEKQLMQNEEYQDLMLSEMDRLRSSTDASMSRTPSNTTLEPNDDSDPMLNSEMETAVKLVRKQLKEMSVMRETIVNQRKQLHFLVNKVKEKKGSVVSLHQNGARPRSRVPSEHSADAEPFSAVVQCEEDLKTMLPDSPNQTLVLPTRPHKPPPSPDPEEHSNRNPFDFTIPPSGPPSAQAQIAQKPPSPYQHILRKKNPPDLLQSNGIQGPPAVGYIAASRALQRDAQRSHSAIIPGGNIFETNEDIYNESLPLGPPSVGVRSNTAPAGYRHSTGQLLFGGRSGESPSRGTAEPLPSPQEWANQALMTNNRPEPLGSADGLENRHRPQAMATQPRPLNIDRNVDDDAPTGGSTGSPGNVNLYPGETREKNQTAVLRRPELLNNDPLVGGKKEIPRRNIFTEELGGLERTDVMLEALASCPVCSQEYPTSHIEEHVSECLPEDTGPRDSAQSRANDTERVCPMCSETFDNCVPQTDFEAHVNRHFGEEPLENFEVLNHP